MIHADIKANDLTTVCRRLQRTSAVAVKSQLILRLVKAESHETGLTGRAAVYLARPVVCLGYGAIFIAGLLQPLWPVAVTAATRNQ